MKPAELWFCGSIVCGARYSWNTLLDAFRVLLIPLFCLSVLTSPLAGCSTVKRDHYDVPAVPLSAQFKNAPADVAATADTPKPSDTQKSADSGKSPEKSEAKLDSVLVDWWHVFDNPELDELINRGLANNPDVRIATFRIDQAKVRAEQSDAGKGPTITAPLGFSVGSPYYGVGGAVPQGANIVGPNGQTVKKLYQAGLQGTWRPDLWGEQSSLAESSKLQLWRATFERDYAQGNMVASIASSYIEYLSLNDRIRVARETEKVLTGMISSIQDRMESGDATAIDLEQQRSAVFSVRATIPALEQQREDALGTMAFLLGSVPESIKLSDKGLDSLSLPSVIPGVPSSLLLRRPDVRMVEARLLAADADIDVARARILPPLDLTAQVGYGSYFLNELFKPQALFWNAISNLSVTIFDGGKLSKEKDYAKAVHEEMVETYVRTIYQAVREVESSLNAIHQTEKRLVAQKASSEAARRAWDFSSEVYTAGAIDYPALLDTERTYHQNLDEFHRIRMDRYNALVNLFHALGGGVPQGATLPGKGNRPTLPPDSKEGVIVASSNGSLPSGSKPAADPLRLNKTPAISPPAKTNPVSTSVPAPENVAPPQQNAGALPQSLPRSSESAHVTELSGEKSAKEITPVTSATPPVVCEKEKLKSESTAITGNEGKRVVSTDHGHSSLPELSGLDFSLPEWSFPEMPSLDISLPEISLSKISLPEISLPEISLPNMSGLDLSLPEFSLPELSLPELSLPDLSGYF